MYALVDCNNFYCSCERVFNPGLKGLPVIVLSNNDGCVIARSEEAKQLGIAMGTPVYLIQDIIDLKGIRVFSSNYTLYADMSDRVMRLLAGFVPSIELYSIDEAFLDMRSLSYQDLPELGNTIRQKITQGTGIPVTVGIAPTKALAKLANRFAKHWKKATGVHCLSGDAMIREALEATAVKDIWGIGHQHAAMLMRLGFRTAADLIRAPDDFIKDKMTVTGLRLVTELRGVQVLELETQPAKRKNICTSRSFGKLTQDKSIVEEAVANFASICACKLREERLCATEIVVFVQTNQFRTQDRQYAHSVRLQAEVATNHTAEFISYALKGLDIVFRAGYQYMKCGVIAEQLLPQQQIQYSLFDQEDRQKSGVIMDALDQLNKSFGKDMVRFAVQRFDRRYRLKADHLSKRYTTNINEVLHVKN